MSLPPEAIPDNPDWGKYYPWRNIRAHSMSNDFRMSIDKARRILDRLPALDWRQGLSCGKDSTAMAVLLQEQGIQIKAMSVKDDLDYPGELEYLRELEPGADILTPPSLLVYLRANRISLVNPVHGRSDALSRYGFYPLLEQYQKEQGYTGILLGLRAEESPGRASNRMFNGSIYKRKSGLTVACPLADWTTLDVHAFLLSREIQLLPVYLCLDQGRPFDSIRKSWWIAGGGIASYQGHYSWLRRWWPDLYEKARSIDPEVSRLS